MRGTELCNSLLQKELQDQSWEMATVAYFTAVYRGLYTSIGEGLLWYLPGDSRLVWEQRLGEVGEEKEEVVGSSVIKRRCT